MNNQPHTPEQKIKRAKFILWLGIAIIIAIGLAVAVYFVFVRQDVVPTVDNATNTKVNASVAVNTNLNSNIDTSDEQTNGNFLVFSPEKLSDPYILYDISSDSLSVRSRLETNINNYEANKFFKAGDKMYYYSWGDRVIKSIDQQGKIEVLAYTKTENQIGPNGFAVSDDGLEIAWVEKSQTTDKNFNNVYIANTKTGQKSLIYEEQLEGEDYLRPIQLSQDNKYLFFSKEPGGIGGYIIFGGFTNLYKLNIESGTATDNLLPTKSGWLYGTEIFDDQKVAYFIKTTIPEFYIYDLESKDEEKVVIENNEGFTGGGNARFSPDGTLVAFNIAHWNSEDEHYRTMLYNVNTKDISILGDYPDNYYYVEKWLGNKYIVQSQRGSTQIIDTKGNIIKEIVN